MKAFKKKNCRLNRFLRERKYRLSVFGMTPHFDWKFLLLVSLITLIVISVVGVTTYADIIGISESDIANDPVEQTYVNPEKVKEFLSEFEQKERRFESLMSATKVAE